MNNAEINVLLKKRRKELKQNRGKVQTTLRLLSTFHEVILRFRVDLNEFVKHMFRFYCIMCLYVVHAFARRDTYNIMRHLIQKRQRKT